MQYVLLPFLPDGGASLAGCLGQVFTDQFSVANRCHNFFSFPPKFQPPRLFSFGRNSDPTEIPNQPMETKMLESDEKGLVAQILSSYLSNNTVAPADLPSVIEGVKRAFSGSGETTPASGSDSKSWEPAVPVKKSVTPEAITCLICGDNFKSLKRHLSSAHQLTPREYREAFKLKSDYPIVAPAYAARRSELAKSVGLGRKVGVKEAAKKARRGRPRKAVDAKTAATE